MGRSHIPRGARLAPLLLLVTGLCVFSCLLRSKPLRRWWKKSKRGKKAERARPEERRDSRAADEGAERMETLEERVEASKSNPKSPRGSVPSRPTISYRGSDGLLHPLPLPDTRDPPGTPYTNGGNKVEATGPALNQELMVGLLRSVQDSLETAQRCCETLKALQARWHAAAIGDRNLPVEPFRPPGRTEAREQPGAAAKPRRLGAESPWGDANADEAADEAGDAGSGGSGKEKRRRGPKLGGGSPAEAGRSGNMGPGTGSPPGLGRSSPVGAEGRRERAQSPAVARGERDQASRRMCPIGRCCVWLWHRLKGWWRRCRQPRRLRSGTSR